MARSAVVVLALATLAAASADEGAAARGAFAVEAAVLLAEAGRRGDEAGYLLRARLHVAPLAKDEGRLLLRFQLEEPTLLLRGGGAGAEWQPRGPAWPTPQLGAFFLTLAEGQAQAAHDSPAAPPHLRNFERALLSLFQFRPAAGERNETDVSGACEALYETDGPRALRKIKRRCSWAGRDDGAGGSRVRRVTRYTLSELGALEGVHAEEVHETGEEGAAVAKARSWLRLRLEGAPSAPADPVPEAPLETQLPPGLRPLPLPLEPVAEADPDPEEGLEEALAAGEAALGGEGPGGGGTAEAASVLLRLLPALRRAPFEALRAQLERLTAGELPPLLRLLALAGTEAAHRAASELLRLRADTATPPAEAYLQALALAPAVAPSVARDLLQLGGEARSPPVAAAALLAAAAAAPTEDAPRIADLLLKQLERCKDDDCRETRLHALGNLRGHAEAATEALLQRAAGPRGPALAALRALRAAPQAALPPEERARLLAVALDAPPSAPRRPRPLEQRAAALELAARRCVALPSQLAPVARALHEAGPEPFAAELRRLLGALLAEMAERGGPARELHGAVLRDPALGSWAARAPGGTSAALAAPAGWAGGGWTASLRSTTVAAGGLLRRGDLVVVLEDPSGAERELLAVELWTRGLQALAGAPDPDPADDPDDPSDPEPVAGGLVLRVAGMLLRPLPLFSGQAELLAQVWAGAGSSPTPLLRALLPLRDELVQRPLAAGVLVLLRSRAAAALAVDAHGHASLWSRTAQAGLGVRAACSADARAEVRAQWGLVRAEVAASTEPRLRLAADLDFYDRPALCVRVGSPPRIDTRSSALASTLGPRRWRVTRRRDEALPVHGLTLALAREAHEACRALPPADLDAD